MIPELVDEVQFEPDAPVLTEEDREFVLALAKVRHLFSGMERHVYDVLLGREPVVSRISYVEASSAVLHWAVFSHQSRACNAVGVPYVVWSKRRILAWFRNNYLAHLTA